MKTIPKTIEKKARRNVWLACLLSLIPLVVTMTLALPLLPHRNVFSEGYTLKYLALAQFVFVIGHFSLSYYFLHKTYEREWMVYLSREYPGNLLGEGNLFLVLMLSCVGSGVISVMLDSALFGEILNIPPTSFFLPGCIVLISFIMMFLFVGLHFSIWCNVSGYQIVRIPIYPYDIDPSECKNCIFTYIEAMIYGEQDSPENQKLIVEIYSAQIKKLKKEHQDEKEKWEAGKLERELKQKEKEALIEKRYKNQEWTPFKESLRS